MREQRLFERIRTCSMNPHRHIGEDSESTLNSIICHLDRLLNTERGSVPIAPDYGVPDLTELKSSFADSIRELEKLMKCTIQKFEPRLEVIDVIYIPHPNRLNLHFHINARLAEPRRSDILCLKAVINPDGQINVRN